MTKTAHQAAIDQAHLLAAYLNDTPSSALDLHFISQHLTALQEFAQAAKSDTLDELWDPLIASRNNGRPRRQEH